MSAKNIIVGEIRTVISRLRQNNRWRDEVARYDADEQETEHIDAMVTLLNEMSDNTIDVTSLDTIPLLSPFIMVLRSPNVTGPIVESVLTALDTFFQSGIITEHSVNITSSISILLDSVSRCRFEATDRNQDEVVLVHMLELLRSTISLPIGFVLSDNDIWSIFDTVFVNSQEVGYSRLLRKVAERVLRDITIIIFRRFSASSTLNELRVKHMQSHKEKGMQRKRQRGTSLTTNSSTSLSPESPITVDNGNEEISGGDQNWDLAALRIVSFLSSRINPDARGVGVSEDDSNNTLCLCLRLMRMALESCGGVIAASEPLFRIISDEFFKHILMLALRPTAPSSVLSEILRIFSFYAATMRVELKLQLEVFFQRLVFWALEGNSRNLSLVPMILDMLMDLSYDPSFLVDLYVNYDCDPQRSDLMEILYRLLSELVLNDKSPSSSSSQTALHIMFNGMKCMDRRIDSRLLQQQRAVDDGTTTSITELTNECEYHINPQMLWVEKLKKRTLQKGALVFNQNAKEGIKYLQEAGLIPNDVTPADIARFLRYTPGLDKQKIGEYVGKNDKENKETLMEYVNTFDFHSVSLLTALRMFLDTFRLPGEAQQIDRVMETFSQYAYEQTIDHDILVNKDVTFCMCFAIIMLNTDLHNPNMKPEKRMQLKDFIHINRSYGEYSNGMNLTDEFLISIYKSIASEQIFTSDVTSNDTLRNEQWVNVIRQASNPDVQQFIAHSPSFFVNCHTCHIGMYDRDIFSIVWGPLLAAAGAVLQEAQDNNLLEFTLENFVTLAHVAAFFNMSTVLDNLVYFLSKFSRITTEHITEEGENDPIEYLVRLGNKPSAQLCLITLCGIFRKLGSNLGKSWDEIVHGLCHLFFLGLFPVSHLVRHQYILMTDSERVDYTVMVDGLVEEKYSNRKGLLSRLFAWSSESENVEQHIQMSPIDPLMWEEFQGIYSEVFGETDVSEDDKKVVLEVPGRVAAVVAKSEEEKEAAREEAKEEERVYMKEETGNLKKAIEEEKENGNEMKECIKEEKDVRQKEDAVEEKENGNEMKEGVKEEKDVRQKEDAVEEKENGNEMKEGVKEEKDVRQKEDAIEEEKMSDDSSYSSSDESYSDKSYSSSSDEESYSEEEEKGSKIVNNPYELTYHETKAIESVLDCVDKCRLDLLFATSAEWSNNTLLAVIQALSRLADSPYQMDQRKDGKDHKTSVIACMYTRVFVVEFITGLVKSNIRRMDVLKDDVLRVLLQIVEDCEYLNFEIQAVTECTFDLIYCFIRNDELAPIHRLLAVIAAVTRLGPDTFQALAPLVASGLTVLIAEYGKTVAVVGCWEIVIEVLNACLQVPHAVTRCYKGIVLMFSLELEDTLPPCTLQLIEFLLNSPYVNPDICSELFDDLHVLHRNCWRIYMQAKAQHQCDDAASDVSISSLWMPLLQVVCRQCISCDETTYSLALTLMHVILTDKVLLLLSSEQYSDIMIQHVLPTLKNLLLNAAGVVTPMGGEKPRVTRVRDSVVLSELTATLVDILLLRFDSLLFLDSFKTIWSQSLNILQFIKTISVPEGSLQGDNAKAVRCILQQAVHFSLFKTESGPRTSELWLATKSMLTGFDCNAIMDSIENKQTEESGV